MRSQLWMDYVLIALAGSGSAAVWTLPAHLNADSIDHMCVALLASCATFSGGGTVTLYLQTAVADSSSDSAWTTIASASLTGTGSHTLLANTSGTPPMGRLRIQLVCSVAATSLTLRLQLLQKQRVDSNLFAWVPPVYLDLAGSTSQTLSADQWIDASRFLHAFALCEWNGTNGAGLTVTLQTAPFATSDDASWLDVASVTMSSDCATIIGLDSVTYPPMGMLRLKYSAASSCSGTLRVTLLTKET